MNGLPSSRSRDTRRTFAVGGVLLVYAALLAFLIPRHAPWADEAQSWQIARSVGLLELFRTTIHYEVTPALWHVLLWPLARLHMTYAGLHWFSGLIAFCGICLVVIASPFPLVLRLALPFTFFFAFQYSVVARSYVLFAPILFLLAIAWPKRFRHPLVPAVLIGLLANVSAHGLVTAIGLAIVLLTEVLLNERTDQRQLRGWLIPIATMLSLVIVAAWCLIPPSDAQWLIAYSAAKQLPLVVIASVMPTSQAWLERLPLVLQVPLKLVLKFGTIFTYGICYPKVVAGVAWFLLVWRWRRERMLRYAIPPLFLGIFCLLGRFDTYHAGLIWVLLLFLWWVTWPRDQEDVRQRMLVFLLAICMAVQIVWSVRVIHYDVTQRYSPDRDAAPILRSFVDKGKSVDVAMLSEDKRGAHPEYFEVGLEPYFDTEPFHDVTARYWIWRPDPTMRTQYVSDTENRSVVVLLETFGNDGEAARERERLEAMGYQQGASVCGRVMYPLQYYEPLCHVFYTPPSIH